MLVCKEDFVNATKDINFGGSGWEEPWTDDVGALYRNAVREYGRCTGHVYMTTSDRDAIPVGWTFVKRMEYEDARTSWRKEDRFYLREVWLSCGERDEDGNTWIFDVVAKRPVYPSYDFAELYALADAKRVAA